MTSREQALVLLAGKTPPGRPLFRVAAQALALRTGCRWAGVGELQEDGETVELLAFWDRDHHAEPFSFRLPGSPCREIYRSRPGDPHRFFPAGVAEEFPDFPLLAELGARSYRGEIFHDRDGRPVGHVFVLDEHDAEDDPEIRDFFRLVAQRIGAEYNRWRAEEAREEFEKGLRWYQNMAAASGEPMAFIDRDYVYRAVNPSYLATIPPDLDGRGWRSEDIVGRTFEDVRGPELFGLVKPDFDRCLAGHEVSFQRWLESPQLCWPGTERPFMKVSLHPYREGDGSPPGLVVILRDLTQRRQQLTLISDLTAHEAIALGHLDEAVHLITEAIATNLGVERAGVWVLDADRRQLRCHRLFAESTRSYSSGETLSMERHPGYFDALRSGRTIVAHDVTMDARTGSLVPSYLEPVGITSLLDAPIRVSGTVIGAVRLEHLGASRIWQADEITFASEAAFLVAQTLMNRDRRLLEQRLAQTQKMESLGVLAGGIAHDFNNLLVGVLGGVDLALAELPPESGARRYLDLVNQSASRASELCSQMLAYAGKGHFVLEPVDLSEALQQSAELLKATIAHRAELDFQLANELPPVEVDTAQLRQIVTHLLDNAAEAMVEDGGSVTLATGLGYCRRADLEGTVPEDDLESGHYVYLEVIDSGRGMDEATRARVFEPFFSTKFTGRGLGMSAVLGIVRSLGGRIKVRSSPGTGTSVRIYFPVLPQESATGDLGTLDRSRGTRANRILIVDDEDIVRQVVREILRSGGYECLDAGGGRQGVAVFEQHVEAIDLVLLDVTMPDLSGDQVLDRIHEIRRDVPVVMISGYSEQDLAERFAGRNVAATLHKPFQADQLLAVVRKALDEQPVAVRGT